MARKTMKRRFADGGAVGKYDARIKSKRDDIESDYKKALAKGKDADVAKAKYDQRMADAADDYAKWTKADRSETRAGEKAAEAALSDTRRYGARKPAEVKMADASPVSVRAADMPMIRPSLPATPVKTATPARRVTPPTATRVTPPPATRVTPPPAALVTPPLAARVTPTTATKARGTNSTNRDRSGGIMGLLQGDRPDGDTEKRIAAEEAVKGKRRDWRGNTYKKGGMVKKARGVGIAQRGHGKGRMC